MDNEGHGNGLVVLFAFLMGALTGALVSLLFAPLTGRETREKIRTVSTDAKDRTVATAHKARERTRDTVTELVGQGKERVHVAKDGVKAAVDAGKKAFTEKKAELADAISHTHHSDDVDEDTTTEAVEDEAV
jgi:gas vesicle protein